MRVMIDRLGSTYSIEMMLNGYGRTMVNPSNGSQPASAGLVGVLECEHGINGSQPASAGLIGVLEC